MALADLHGDGDHKRGPPPISGTSPHFLLPPPPPAGRGDPPRRGGPRLTVLRGAGTLTSLALPDAPAGLGAFGVTPSGGGGGNLGGPGGAPALVVAAGSALYVYRNLRPFYKYSLPPQPPHPLERDLWLQAAQDQIDPLMLKEMLEDLRDKAEVPLTARSLRLLALPPPSWPPSWRCTRGARCTGRRW
ncbi:BBSome complex member BBS1 [Morphnus guianensis]